MQVTANWLAAAAIAAASGASAATIVFDCSKIPNVCSNDCYAIDCRGKPFILHRDSENATLHRSQNACKPPNRCLNHPSDSNSCDEYPFASSSEGGACAVTRCVPAHENSVQGGLLSAFYTYMRVDDGDAYSVGFAATHGLQYCAGDCRNTGNEQISFQSDGASARAQVAMDAAAGERSAVKAYRRRYLLTVEEHTVLMFESVAEAGSLNSMIGQDVWLAHEQRTVKIAGFAPWMDGVES